MPCRARAFSLWSLPQYTASLCGLRGEAMMGELFLIAGVDEAGRGPLAGPVSAAAVFLDPARPIEGLADSMLLTAQRREALEIEIKKKALAKTKTHAEVE